MLVESALALIGNTPLVRLNRFDTGPCELYAKLESQNPGGSIKDRIGLRMIEAAERQGRLAPGGLIVEATAGNTGLGLALAAIFKGYRLKLVIPDKMSQEKISHLRAMGVEIVMTRSDVGKGHPDYYQDMARRIAQETPGAFYIDQFSNPANSETHETWTAPEIFRQMNGDLDAVVTGVGTGGTLTGMGRFFKRSAPHVLMVLADPAGSILADLVNTGRHAPPGSWLVEGIGEDFIPDILDLSLVGKAYTITDTESLLAARDLLRLEGIMAGSSSGTLLAAALRYCREQKQRQRVVTIVCDGGNKYLSKMYNDYWLADQGILSRERKGDLSDLVGRRHGERATVTIGPQEPLATAYARMKLHDFQQLPVLEAGRIIGIIDESDILLQVSRDPAQWSVPVASAMSTRLTTLSLHAPVATAARVLSEGLVVIVLDGDEFVGLITRYDLLNHLRQRH
jgi:cystathionine beta-synthase